MVICNVTNTEEFEHLEQRLAVMAKGHRSVVRIALFDQNMVVEAPHFGNGEQADAAEAARCDRKNLALCNIGTQRSVAVTLQAIEGNLGSRKIALQRAAREVGRAAILEISSAVPTGYSGMYPFK